MARCSEGFWPTDFSLESLRLEAVQDALVDLAADCPYYQLARIDLELEFTLQVAIRRSP